MNILEIDLQTDCLEETEAFYSELLGLTIVNKEENAVSFLAGLSKLTFIRSNAVNPKYHFAFNIPKNKLDEAMIWTSNRTVLIKNPEGDFVTNFDNWNARSIYFYDNNRNILEFIARFDLENSSNIPFDGKSIQSISEVGVVADKPLVLAEKLINENRLSYFSKGPKTKDFVVLGDDNGLIVISNPNRSWYPGKDRVEKHDLRIKVFTEKAERQIIIRRETAN